MKRFLIVILALLASMVSLSAAQAEGFITRRACIAVGETPSHVFHRAGSKLDLNGDFGQAFVLVNNLEAIQYPRRIRPGCYKVPVAVEIESLPVLLATAESASAPVPTPNGTVFVVGPDSGELSSPPAASVVAAFDPASIPQEWGRGCDPCDYSVGNLNGVVLGREDLIFSTGTWENLVYTPKPLKLSASGEGNRHIASYIRVSVSGFVLESNYLSAWEIYSTNIKHAFGLIKKHLLPYAIWAAGLCFLIGTLFFLGREVLRVGGIKFYSRQILVGEHLLPYEPRHSRLSRLKYWVSIGLRSSLLGLADVPDWINSLRPARIQTVEQDDPNGLESLPTWELEIPYFVDSNGMFVGFAKAASIKEPRTIRVLVRNAPEGGVEVKLDNNRWVPVQRHEGSDLVADVYDCIYRSRRDILLGSQKTKVPQAA